MSIQGLDRSSRTHLVQWRWHWECGHSFEQVDICGDPECHCCCWYWAAEVASSRTSNIQENLRSLTMMMMVVVMSCHPPPSSVVVVHLVRVPSRVSLDCCLPHHSWPMNLPSLWRSKTVHIVKSTTVIRYTILVIVHAIIENFSMSIKFIIAHFETTDLRCRDVSDWPRRPRLSRCTLQVCMVHIILSSCNTVTWHTGSPVAPLCPFGPRIPYGPCIAVHKKWYHISTFLLPFDDEI